MEQQSHSLSEIAQYLGARFEGDGSCIITGMSSLDKAQQGTISFLLSKQYKKYLETTQASAVVLPDNFTGSVPCNAIYMPNPNIAYAKLAQLFAKKKSHKVGVHASSVVGETCQIDASVSIGPNCVIGNNVKIGANSVLAANVVIGDDVIIGQACHLFANVSIYDGVKIGDRVLIHSGAVIGADGFGMINDAGRWQKIPQLGAVAIGNDVEVGANTTIDRGAMEDTIIEEGVKLDNLIMIAHNVHIGAHTAIAGCVGIAGSTKIGKHCMIGGATGIADHLEICDQVMFTGNCFVTKSISEPGVYSSGLPAQPREKWQRSVVQFRRLNELAAKVKNLERVKDD